MNDFIFSAFEAIRELGEIVKENPRPNDRLEALVDDLHHVAVRYLRGDSCSAPGCRSRAEFVPIATTAFCSAECRAAHLAAAVEQEQRIAEAVAEHIGGADG